MRHFTVFLFLMLSLIGFSQPLVKGSVHNELSYNIVPSVNILNLTTLKISHSKPDGTFELKASLGDTLHFSKEGYTSLKMKVTNDWLKGYAMKVYIKDASTVLDELTINKSQLTGYLQVDVKLIALSIYPYTRSFNAVGFTPEYNNYFNPVKSIYNAFKRNSKSTKRIEKIKKDIELIELMKTKYDRETVSVLLNISKRDIVSLLERCNYSQTFIYTASDFQVFNAINQCSKNNLN